MMTLMDGCCSRSAFSVSMPSNSGISTSRIRASGLSVGIFIKAIFPFDAVPTTSIYGTSDSMSESPRRNTIASSTIRTRNDFVTFSTMSPINDHAREAMPLSRTASRYPAIPRALVNVATMSCAGTTSSMTRCSMNGLRTCRPTNVEGSSARIRLPCSFIA